MKEAPVQDWAAKGYRHILLNEAAFDRWGEEDVYAFMDQCDKLERELARIPAGSKDAMKFCHSVIIPAMDAARETADAMETLMDIKYWPFPVYSDLLFSV